MRRFLVATVACGVLISGATIASAVVLADIVAGVITDPSPRSLRHWAGPLWILLALWIIRDARALAAGPARPARRDAR